MIAQPANRTTTIREYYFSGKLREIEQMNLSGHRVINLGIGSPDMAPDNRVIENLCAGAINPENHAYQSYKGVKELREAFASWYSRYYNVKLDGDREIQLLTGSKEGILMLSLAYINPGDEVLIPNPGYPTYSSATSLAEGVSVKYDLIEENGWLPDFDSLEKMDLSRVKLMWTNYPNMPTGTRATMEVYEKLVAFGKKHNILICNDNPYSCILTDDYLSILAVNGAIECCVELNSLSKAFNMAGWRVGMIAGHEEVIQQVLKVKSNMDSGMFRPLQLAAAEALNLNEEWYANLNAEYKIRQKLAGAIFTLLGIRYQADSCGLFLWGKIGDEWKNGEELSNYLLKTARVFVTPGFIFGSNGEKYVRISLCASQDVLSNALARIRESLNIKTFCNGSSC